MDQHKLHRNPGEPWKKRKMEQSESHATKTEESNKKKENNNNA